VIFCRYVFVSLNNFWDIPLGFASSLELVVALENIYRTTFVLDFEITNVKFLTYRAANPIGCIFPIMITIIY
jgi:hypothetical protein